MTLLDYLVQLTVDCDELTAEEKAEYISAFVRAYGASQQTA